MAPGSSLRATSWPPPARPTTPRLPTMPRLGPVSLTRFRGHRTLGLWGSGEGVHVPRTRPPYTPEFRAEAVRLYRTSYRGLKRISAELGIAPESLRRWAQQ